MFDYKRLSRINDSKSLKRSISFTKVSDSDKKLHATTEDADTFYAKLSSKGLAEMDYHTLNGEEVYSFYLNGDKVATFFPKEEELYLHSSFEHPEFLADAEEFREFTNFYYNLKNDVKELLHQFGIDNVDVNFSLYRSLPYGFFNYPSIKIKSYDEVYPEEVTEINNLLSGIEGTYLTNKSGEFAEFYLTFDPAQHDTLQKLLNLKSINDSALDKHTVLTADQVASIDTEFFECPDSCISQSELGHNQLYWHKGELVATLDKQTMELSYTKSFSDNIQTSLEEKEDFMDKVEISDSEDAEVIAETLIRAESLVEEIGKVLFEETGKYIKDFVSVDYDGDTDTIKVEVDPSVGSGYQSIHEAFLKEFGDTFYVTDSLSEETPIFYICFDAETADNFKND